MSEPPAFHKKAAFLSAVASRITASLLHARDLKTRPRQNDGGPDTGVSPAHLPQCGGHYQGYVSVNLP
jgi:hypothetical protein